MPSSRAGRLTAVGIGVVLLALVSYLVARSREDVSDAWVGIPDGLMDNARDLAIAAVIVLAVLIVIGIVMALATRDPGATFRAPRNSSIFGLITLVLLVGIAWFLVRTLPEGTFDFGDGGLADGLAPIPPDETVIEPDGPEGVVFWLVVLSVGLGVWALVAWRRSRPELTAGARDPDAALRGRRLVLAGLLDEAIARLRDHPEPREATIAAWARLETALEAVGVPRRRSDTPSTYLRRVLEEVDTSGPAVQALTAAYERAMFSPHRIDRATQLESVEALVAVRDELRVLERAGELTGA